MEDQQFVRGGQQPQERQPQSTLPNFLWAMLTLLASIAIIVAGFIFSDVLAGFLWNGVWSKLNPLAQLPEYTIALAVCGILLVSVLIGLLMEGIAELSIGNHEAWITRIRTLPTMGLKLVLGFLVGGIAFSTISYITHSITAGGAVWLAVVLCTVWLGGRLAPKQNNLRFTLGNGKRFLLAFVFSLGIAVLWLPLFLVLYPAYWITAVVTAFLAYQLNLLLFTLGLPAIFFIEPTFGGAVIVVWCIVIGIIVGLILQPLRRSLHL